jgi:hypothetical protein
MTADLAAIVETATRRATHGGGDFGEFARARFVINAAT